VKEVEMPPKNGGPHAGPEARDIRFDLEGVPRDWHGGERARTRYFDNLSVFFPPGERFFVTSVKAHRARAIAAAPHLDAAVRAFCAQESFHGREHSRHSDRLRALGYPIDDMEQKVTQLIARWSARFPPIWHLAATCALEHYTALLAHYALADPRVFEDAHPVMAELWRWHAAEESEHKAVAFDVYEAVGGTYGVRALSMAVVSVLFWGKVLEHQVRLMRHDGILFSAREWRSLFVFNFVRPGGMRRIVGPLLAYFRPGFHPHDLDTEPLLDAWKRAFEASPHVQRAPHAPIRSRGASAFSGSAERFARLDDSRTQ
jgi:hypothetical protein